MNKSKYFFFVFILSALVFLSDKYFFMLKKDAQAPVLKLPSQKLECSINDGIESLLIGAEAIDNVDGDLTNQIFIESLSPFISENTRLLTVAVVDSAGNVSKATRTIVYNDYKSPKFTMSQPLSYYAGVENVTQYIGAYDEIEGNISSNVRVTSKYRLKAEAGEYPLEFVASNSMGDAVYFTATVTLYDVMTILNTPSVSIALTDYLVYTDGSREIDPYSYIQSITLNSRIYANKTPNDTDEYERTDSAEGTNEHENALTSETGNESDSYGTNNSIAGFSSSVFDNREEKKADSLTVEAINPEITSLLPLEDYGPSDDMPEEISLAEIQVSSDVNYDVAGSYEILYKYSYDDYTASVRLVVIVE